MNKQTWGVDPIVFPFSLMARLFSTDLNDQSNIYPPTEMNEQRLSKLNVSVCVCMCACFVPRFRYASRRYCSRVKISPTVTQLDYRSVGVVSPFDCIKIWAKHTYTNTRTHVQNKDKTCSGKRIHCCNNSAQLSHVLDTCTFSLSPYLPRANKPIRASSLWICVCAHELAVEVRTVREALLTSVRSKWKRSRIM